MLSFGTAGCCRFCQNWDISKSKEVDTLADQASPEALADAASRLACASVAFTYNDPVIFHEYAIDVADACHERGIKAVAVTAGYVCSEPRAEFYAHMDAANVDLKAFSEEFYRHTCGAHLEAVKETLRYLRHERTVWFEITNRLVAAGLAEVARRHALDVELLHLRTSADSAGPAGRVVGYGAFALS